MSEDILIENIEDTEDRDIMLENSIDANKIDDRSYLVLREWNKVTPYVIHYWDALSGYYWGAYLATSDLKEARDQYFKKLSKVRKN